jgi:uncharacterized membrane protein YgcG
MKNLSIVIAAMLLASCSGMDMSGSSMSGSSTSRGMNGTSGSYGTGGSDSDVPYSMRPFSDNNPYGG